MACLDLDQERRRALGEPEGDQETAVGREGAGRLRQCGAANGVAGAATEVGDQLGETDDRLAAGVVAEQQRQQQSQQRQRRKQECDELGHAARILSGLNRA